jgi:hypothetical protein
MFRPRFKVTGCDLEAEVSRESLAVPLYRLVQRFCGNSVELREVGVEKDFFATNSANQWGDAFDSRRGHSPVTRDARSPMT